MGNFPGGVDGGFQRAARHIIDLAGAPQTEAAQAQTEAPQTGPTPGNFANVVGRTVLPAAPSAGAPSDPTAEQLTHLKASFELATSAVARARSVQQAGGDAADVGLAEMHATLMVDLYGQELEDLGFNKANLPNINGTQLGSPEAAWAPMGSGDKIGPTSLEKNQQVIDLIEAKEKVTRDQLKGLEQKIINERDNKLPYTDFETVKGITDGATNNADKLFEACDTALTAALNAASRAKNQQDADKARAAVEKFSKQLQSAQDEKGDVAKRIDNISSITHYDLKKKPSASPNNEKHSEIDTRTQEIIDSKRQELFKLLDMLAEARDRIAAARFGAQASAIIADTREASRQTAEGNRMRGEAVEGRRIAEAERQEADKTRSTNKEADKQADAKAEAKFA